MTNSTSNFRVGLLLDEPLVSKHVVNFVRRSKSAAAFQISDLIIRDPDDFNKDSRYSYANFRERKKTRGIIPGALFGLIFLIERLLLLKNAQHRDHLQRFDIRESLPDAAIRNIEANGDLHTIGSLNLDLLISFSDLRPADVARLGTLSLSYSTDFVTQQRHSCFWEAYFRCDVTDFVIQRTSAAFDGPETILRGRIGTEFYWLLNQASVFEKSHYYLFSAVKNVAVTGSFPQGKSDYPISHLPLNAPSARQSIAYLAGLVRLLTIKAMEKVRGPRFDWNVGFVHHDWRAAALWRASVIPNPSRDFLADPFVIHKNGICVCYVEAFDKRTNRGRIAAYALKGDSSVCLGDALVEDFHLSYPFLFEYESELYMCPETSESREIRIYKCVDFPLRWKLEKVIMKDIAAVDTMLFERDGKWWMLTNTDGLEVGDFSLELRIFSANSPLAENWTAHPGNPFFIDASRARNGGAVRDGEVIYRVAQAKGFDMYGKRSQVYEIVELTDQNYREEIVCTISPKFKIGIAATHHLNSDGLTTVIDFAHDGRGLRPVRA